MGKSKKSDSQKEELIESPVEFKANPNDTAYKSKKKEAFIREFPKHGTLTPTAEAVKIAPSTVYEWLEKDPEFAKAFEACDQAITDRLEKRAVAKALGVEDGATPLLIFLLKCRNKRYRERIVQEIDPKTIDFLVSSFIESIKKNVPEFCPSCKTNLKFTETIAKELSDLSSKFASL